MFGFGSEIFICPKFGFGGGEGGTQKCRKFGYGKILNFAVIYFFNQFAKFGSGLCDAEVRDNKVREFCVYFGFSPSLI